MWLFFYVAPVQVYTSYPIFTKISVLHFLPLFHWYLHVISLGLPDFSSFVSNREAISRRWEIKLMIRQWMKWVEKHGTDICIQVPENKILQMESIAVIVVIMWNSSWWIIITYHSWNGNLLSPLQFVKLSFPQYQTLGLQTHLLSKCCVHKQVTCPYVFTWTHLLIYLHTYLLIYVLTYSFHRAESFLRS